jgi:hypothetical protein
VNQAEVEGAIASYFGVPATTPGIGELARVVFSGVQEASRGNPAAWRSVVLSVLANHIGMAQGLGLQGSELQRQLQIMRASNRTSADFVHALRAVQTLVAGMGGWSRVARAVEGGGRSPNSNSYTALGGFSADRLPMEMRRYVDRYGAHHVAAVGNYLSGLGMHQHEVHQYAGFFVGSSETVRHAIHARVHHGQALTDEHVTSAADARAIMGAIRAGRIRPEDAPPSVRRLMERMEREGVDPTTADPSRIQQFFDHNPNALEEAKREITVHLTGLAGTTREDTAAVTARALTAGQLPLPGQESAQKRPQPLAVEEAALKTAQLSPSGQEPAQKPPQPPRQTASTLDLG